MKYRHVFEKTNTPLEAEKCFMELSKFPGASFLGLKGQIHAALQRGDSRLAYVLLENAEQLVPTSPWVLNHLLTLAHEQKNFTKAIYWFRKAAEQGDAFGQCNLGSAFVNGEGVEHDKIEAVKWFRLAAEQGYANAQFNMGYSYAKGYGLKKDKIEAVKWLRLAAEQGYEDAEEMLVRLDEEDYLNQDDDNGF